MRWQITTITILIFTLCNNCYAIATGNGREVDRYEAVTLANTQIRKITSKNTGVNYKLFISLPASYYGKDKKRYPTLYLLDPDYCFGIAKLQSEHLTDRDQMQEVLLVGIGYDGPNHYRLNRTRDYTISYSLNEGYPPEIQKVSGGAKKFQKFIKEELIPYIEANFPVTASRGIAGHSYGGLFAAYTLVDDPSIFDKYIIGSASLWYDQKKLIKMAAAKKDFNQNIAHTVYFAVGSEENGGSYQMIDDQNTFVALLNSKPHKNLNITAQILDQFNHDTGYPGTLARGMTVLYANK